MPSHSNFAFDHAAELLGGHAAVGIVFIGPAAGGGLHPIGGVGVVGWQFLRCSWTAGCPLRRRRKGVGGRGGGSGLGHGFDAVDVVIASRRRHVECAVVGVGGERRVPLPSADLPGVGVASVGLLRNLGGGGCGLPVLDPVEESPVGLKQVIEVGVLAVAVGNMVDQRAGTSRSALEFKTVAAGASAAITGDEPGEPAEVVIGGVRLVLEGRYSRASVCPLFPCCRRQSEVRPDRTDRRSGSGFPLPPSGRCGSSSPSLGGAELGAGPVLVPEHAVVEGVISELDSGRRGNWHW